MKGEKIKGIIRMLNRHGFEDYYLEIQGTKSRPILKLTFSSAHHRITRWRCSETGKEVQVLIYPSWSYMEKYIDKEVTGKVLVD